MGNISREELFTILESAGIDSADLSERLMDNMELISKFLKRFPFDESFERLTESLEKDQCDDAFRAAHALKGLSSNLSMIKLYKLAASLVEVLRNGDIEAGKEMIVEVSAEYNKMVETVNSIKWE